MKAGIYKRRDNGKHIYIRKDRTIGAFQLNDVHPSDHIKVASSEKGQVVRCDTDGVQTFTADRVADVPNGCTDPVGALHAYVTSGVETIDVDVITSEDQAKRIADACATVPTFSFDADPAEAQALFGPEKRFHAGGPVGMREGEVAAVLSMPREVLMPAAFAAPYGVEKSMRADGWRPVHRQSARKHRRKGDEVKWVPQTRCYWWRPQA